LKGEQLGKINFGPGLDCTCDGAYPDFDTVEYSWELLTELYDPFDFHQLPVIQCHYGDIKSLKDYISNFKKNMVLLIRLPLEVAVK